MNAVGQAAFDMIEEVRRQFKKNTWELWKEKLKPDYARCVDIVLLLLLGNIIPIY